MGGLLKIFRNRNRLTNKYAKITTLFQRVVLDDMKNSLFSRLMLFHEHSVREITEAEYHQVMAIRKPEDVYHGWDYLPDYFLPLVRTPGYTAYASYVHTKLVAFGLSVVVDDGETLVTRAGRVSIEYEGKGVFKQLDKYIRNKYETMPNVLYQAVTFTNENQRMKDSVESGSFKFIFSKNIHTYRSSVDKMRQYLRSYSVRNGNTVTINKDRMEKIFTSKGMRDSLFPDNRFVIDWVPYRPLTSNAHFMITDRCLILGTQSGQQNQQELHPFLTCGTFLRCNAGFNYNFDVYGNSKMDLAEHVFNHLKSIEKRFSGQIRFVIYSYKDLTSDYCDDVMGSFGFQRMDSPIFQQHCAEKTLVKQ